MIRIRRKMVETYNKPPDDTLRKVKPSDITGKVEFINGKEYLINPDGTKVEVERKSTLIKKSDMPDLSDEEIEKMNNVLRINRVVLSTIDSNENLRKDLKTHYDVVRVTLNILSQFGVLKDATKALEELKKNDK